MKTLEEIKTILKSNYHFLKTEYGVVYLGIFGSIVRSENSKKSDIDILIDFEDNKLPSFFSFLNIEDYLSKLLKTKRIDLVMKRNLRKRIGQQILSEVIEI